MIWPNRDPIGEQGEINLYGYVGNDPCDWIDSDGRAILPPYPPSRPYFPPAPRPEMPSYPGGGNCYNYACNRPPSPTFPYSELYPGQRAGLPDLGRIGGWNCESLSAGVKGDYSGDANVGTRTNGKCPPSYHAIKPEVTSNGIGFHFKRQNPDGSWSEKLGSGRDKPSICKPKTPGYDGDKQCPDICVPN